MNLGVTDPGRGEETSPPYTCVATTESFRAMMESLRPAGRLAIDIEADSLYHYFEKVCLIQISTDTETFVLDPLVIRDLTASRPAHVRPRGRKGVPRGDLRHPLPASRLRFQLRENLRHACGRPAGRVRAARSERPYGKAAGHQPLQAPAARRLVAPALWRLEQLEYAAMDTHHLLHLRDVLEEQLREKDRLSWAQEEFEIGRDCRTAGTGIRSRRVPPDQREPGPLRAGTCGAARAVRAARPLRARARRSRLQGPEQPRPDRPEPAAAAFSPRHVPSCRAFRTASPASTPARSSGPSSGPAPRNRRTVDAAARRSSGEPRRARPGRGSSR